VRVPDIGDFKDVAVIELLVKVGDTVKAEQSLITVESDKASMEILRAAGVVKELKVKLGDKVNQGSLVAILEGATSAAAPAPVAAAPASAPAVAAAAPAAAVATAPVASAVPAHEPTVAPSGKLPHASPRCASSRASWACRWPRSRAAAPRAASPRRTCRLRQGRDGRPGAAAQKAAAPAAGRAVASPACCPGPRSISPSSARSSQGPVAHQEDQRRQPARNWVMIPAVTYHDDADITDLEAFRVQLNKENEKSGVKLTMLAFLIKACVGAAEVPRVQQLAGRRQPGLQEVLPHRLCGRHAQRPGGAGDQGRRQEERARDRRRMGELAKKARDGKLGPADMQGACFTISSLGGIGGTYFAPIVNAPEVAILGVNKSVMKPVWDGKAFQPRLMLPLSLTADHRVIDGALATRFNVYLAQLLADFRRIAL
jgi:pyruvate dehydrogenase E2 component (dihydrolipoamide acetyltransferase)